MNSEILDWYKSSRWERAPKHVISAAVTVLDNSGDILLVKSPYRGWEIPGGQVELGESLSSAAAREVEEESGVIVEVTDFCGIFQTVSRSICNLLFLGKPIGGTPTTSSESLEVGWFKLPQALDMITHDNFRSRIQHSLNKELHPFVIEYEDA